MAFKNLMQMSSNIVKLDRFDGVNMTEISDANDASANDASADMVNSMMSYPGLSSGYWGEALLTACYILNRVPRKRSIKTPYELWNQRTPKLDYLQIWGCRAIVRIPESEKIKFGDKGIECIFLGYAQNSKAYRFIVVEPNDLISINTIIESRDARFDKNRFRTTPKAHEISKETVSTEITITTEGNNDDSPDIAYAIERLSWHTSSPGKEHQDAANRVFKYLKKTIDYGLEYNGDPLVLEGYTDASLITDQEDYASTSGWILLLVGVQCLGDQGNRVA
uniref:Zinc finger, CCHC-type n=1 Tax=Tanacetum cinerariifolium TaxID=118510 RepID=A0A6L2N3M5_TANCI|nr:zinc finger, CCHC-type [Tanacetum cinerariifolium]